MPKRFGNLYGPTFTLDRLHAAYLVARKGKRKTRSVQIFERDLGANLAALQKELQSGTFAPSPYRHFVVYGPNPASVANCQSDDACMSASPNHENAEDCSVTDPP